ncbi:recombination protein RecR [Candidatus Peregrinibacteria bacterium]|nr:recombination protein RecR [Candidatus Peregrinibacteria bacterium]
MNFHPGALPKSIESLIEEFSRLPGVGTKTAQRFVFFLLEQPEEVRNSFGKSVLDLTKNLEFCRECHHFSEGNLCNICKDSKRSDHIICIVEDSLDLLSIERSGAFRGRYHILGGVISPLDGIGPNELRIRQLTERIMRSDGKIQEVILATNPTMEGEATATYLWRTLHPLKVKISRIARGLTVGGDLEFTDEVTLARAIESRVLF